METNTIRQYNGDKYELIYKYLELNTGVHDDNNVEF